MDQGFDVTHTDDLPNRNETHDLEIADRAVAENRIVITKDSDFLKLKILENKPQKLLLITTGNISNTNLLNLFSENFPTIVILFQTFEIVELSNTLVMGRNLD
jgi:predicted nuclease of predicted toxin-antitoxin system